MRFTAWCRYKAINRAIRRLSCVFLIALLGVCIFIALCSLHAMHSERDIVTEKTVRPSVRPSVRLTLILHLNKIVKSLHHPIGAWPLVFWALSPLQYYKGTPSAVYGHCWTALQASQAAFGGGLCMVSGCFSSSTTYIRELKRMGTHDNAVNSQQARHFSNLEFSGVKERFFRGNTVTFPGRKDSYCHCWGKTCATTQKNVKSHVFFWILKKKT